MATTAVTPPRASAEAGGQPDDTATRLVGAAVEVFAEKGYDNAGVAEIARRAGLTTGAIYSRFSGKAELLAEAIRACTSDELDRLFAQQQLRGRAPDLLATVGAHLLGRELQPGQAILLEAFVAARRDPEVALVLRNHLDERAVQLAELIDESKANGLVDPDVDTAAVVHFAHAVGLGFLTFEAVGSEHPEPAAWEDVIRRVVASISPDHADPSILPDDRSQRTPHKEH